MDLKRFMATQFVPREEDVPVPDLAAFFPEGSAPVIRVRGLTGQELGRVQEAAKKYRDVATMVEALVSADNRERVQEMRKLLGVADDLPAEVARKLEMLVIGSVAPKFDLQASVKLCQVHPIEFYSITNKITELTGAGYQPGEPRGSGAATTSGQASTSPATGESSSTSADPTSSPAAS